jgi:hypothetical protein
MYTLRVTVSFIAIWVIGYCLVLGGFASPALAKNIVVTTLEDRADPPFDADSPCGTGTISDLYRPDGDGLVSLREAIIAANNTAGADTITFQSGGSIAVTFDDADTDSAPDPLPAFCGGQTSINGDLDGDDAPDITLEGATFPVVAPLFTSAAGILVLSSHNTINGLRIQHFPVGIRVRAGDLTNLGTVEHTRVTNNILAESKLDGLFVATGNVPDSLVAHTTITQNEVSNNARFGIFVVASLSAAGSDSHIDHTTITDNEVTGNGALGIFVGSLGDHNVITDASLVHNTVSDNNLFGINASSGTAGADENTLDIHIKDNTVTDNGVGGIRVNAGQDNSSNNHIVAQVRGNTVERNRQLCGILVNAAVGTSNPIATGTSNNNVLDVGIVQNTVRSQTGTGICVAGAGGGQGGQAGAIADNNQVTAIVRHNVVEDSTAEGIYLAAGADGLASGNTLDVRVAHNTVCNNGAGIVGEGGASAHPPLPPNLGTGNVLTGEISKNTATVVVQDGVQNGMPENTADVTQFNNDPCL